MAAVSDEFVPFVFSLFKAPERELSAMSVAAEDVRRMISRSSLTPSLMACSSSGVAGFLRIKLEVQTGPEGDHFNHRSFYYV